jgi:hypothetical protein
LSDLLLVALLLHAFGLSARHRSRFGALGLGVSAFCLALVVLLALAGWHSRRLEEMGGWGAVLMVFVGPGVAPGVSDRVPFSAALAAFPLASRVLVVALCAGACGVMFHAAPRSGHESDAADRLRRLGLAFVLPAVVAVALPLFFALADRLADF